MEKRTLQLTAFFLFVGAAFVSWYWDFIFESRG